MSTRLLNDNIDSVHVPQSQLIYILGTTYVSHKHLVELFHDLHYMYWGNQEFNFKDWEYSIKSKKIRILSITMLVPNNNPTGNKELVIYCIIFSFSEVITIIDWIAKMNLCVSDIVESYKKSQ